MLYQLSNAGCIVTVQGRDPDTVLRAVEWHKVELLPTSPTFIQPYSPKRSLSPLRFVFLENRHLRDGANAREHAAPVSSGAAQSSFNRLTGCRKSASCVRNHARPIHSGSSWGAKAFRPAWWTRSSKSRRSRRCSAISTRQARSPTTAGLIPATRSKWTATISESSGAV
jgi:hypothetical protein